jgi:hypothetical protein
MQFVWGLEITKHDRRPRRVLHLCFSVGLDLRRDDKQTYKEIYLLAQTWSWSVILRDRRHVVLKCACMLLRYTYTTVGG